MPALLFPLSTLLACSVLSTDGDGDGSPYSQDCNDSDASIYPGAAANEIVGDGIDSDCDGLDPSHAYVGTWAIREITLEGSGTHNMLFGSELTITDGLGAALEGTWNHVDRAYTMRLQSANLAPRSTERFDLSLLGTLETLRDGEEEEDTAFQPDTPDYEGARMTLVCEVSANLVCQGDLLWVDERLDVELVLER